MLLWLPLLLLPQLWKLIKPPVLAGEGKNNNKKTEAAETQPSYNIAATRLATNERRLQDGPLRILLNEHDGQEARHC